MHRPRPDSIHVQAHLTQRSELLGDHLYYIVMISSGVAVVDSHMAQTVIVMIPMLYIIPMVLSSEFVNTIRTPLQRGSTAVEHIPF